MLNVRELRILDRWCGARRLSWGSLPASEALAGRPALRIFTPGRDGPGAMYLTASARGFELRDGQGEALAFASDLPALLDAVDGGVAEPLPMVLRAAIGEFATA
jgi:hypothetical protein